MAKWLIPLVGWPVLITFLPLQDYLVQLVGLRGNVFLVLFLLFGAQLTSRDWFHLAIYVAGLNLVALVFAGAEYKIGVPQFYPFGPATEIIYLSKDLLGNTEFRIPAIFTSAHSYGGTMVLTLPMLISAFIVARGWLVTRLVLAGGIVAAILGVLLCAARLPFIVMSFLFCVTALNLKRHFLVVVALVICLGGILYFTAGTERLQRFTTLSDTEMVSDRFALSTSSSIIDTIVDYPLGNGIGAGGTSMPYFLESRLVNRIWIENEYFRIQLELGLPGLILWVGFLVLTVFRKGYVDPTDAIFARAARGVIAGSALSGLIGTGLLTSIPATALLFCYAGWLHRMERSPVPNADRLTDVDMTKNSPSPTSLAPA